MVIGNLYNSTIKVQRLKRTVVDGFPSTSLVDVPGLTAVKCRLDLTFLRQGKDVPAPVEAGKAPDRMGVMFCDTTVPLKAGDTIVATGGPFVGSAFEIRAIPDVAQGFSAGHHVEVQIIETNQKTEGKISG